MCKHDFHFSFRLFYLRVVSLFFVRAFSFKEKFSFDFLTMVRISSKVSHRQIKPKKKPSKQPIKLNSNTNDKSSSKILNVVRQALLNAAEELVAQQHGTNEDQVNGTVSFHELDIKKNDSNKSSCQQNSNAIRKKKPTRVSKPISKTNRRK